MKVTMNSKQNKEKGMELTKYKEELEWLKTQPIVMLEDTLSTYQWYSYFQNERVDLTIQSWGLKKYMVKEGLNKNGTYCIVPCTTDNVELRGIFIPDECEIIVKKTRIYLTIFEHSKKYKFTKDWTPLTEIPEWLEEQLTYMKMKELI